MKASQVTLPCFVSLASINHLSLPSSKERNLPYSIRKIDLFVEDVIAASALLRDAFEFAEIVAEEGFAELQGGPITLMLSKDARIPMPLSAGVTIHLEVSDVEAAAAHAKANGAETLLPIEQTPWGTTSALFRGPAGLVLDLYSESTDRG